MESLLGAPSLLEVVPLPGGRLRHAGRPRRPRRRHRRVIRAAVRVERGGRSGRVRHRGMGRASRRRRRRECVGTYVFDDWL